MKTYGIKSSQENKDSLYCKMQTFGDIMMSSTYMTLLLLYRAFKDISSGQKDKLNQQRQLIKAMHSQTC